jgi:hypothetical protein
MTEVKYQGAGPQARINKRLENSGAGAKPNVTVQNGESAQRVFHNIHHSGHYVDPATRARESDAQSQLHHDEATTQSTTSYFTGHKSKHDGEHDE